MCDARDCLIRTWDWH